MLCVVFIDAAQDCPVQARTSRLCDEPLEVLAEVRREAGEWILVVFLDGEGRRLEVRLGKRVAGDLHDALDEILQA